MKIKKSIFLITLCFCLILTICYFAFSSNDLNLLKKQNNIENVSSYDDYEPLISDVLNFDELIDEISKDSSISKGEASKFFRISLIKLMTLKYHLILQVIEN